MDSLSRGMEDCDEASTALKLGVVGSRTFDDYALLEQTLNEMLPIALIVSGGAKGADELAERYAEHNNIPCVVCPAEWSKYGRAAGPIRNKDIVSRVNRVVAFWDGESRGTMSTIKIAEKQNVSITIIAY